MGFKQSAVSTGLALALATGAAQAQDLKPVPRNRTLISQGWDFYNQVPSPTSMSPYAGLLLHQRNSLHYTVNEMLFYTNHMTNEISPWQAESFSYNDAFTEMTVKIRDKVKWSDGQPFTADDVVFSLDMLKSVAPDLLMSSAIKEWVAKAEAPDSRTVKITLTKPGPRWVQDFLRPGPSGALRRRAEAYLGRTGSEDLQFLRPPKGLARRHRPLQAGEKRLGLDRLRPPRLMVGRGSGHRSRHAGHRTSDLQARHGRRRSTALHQQ